MNIFCRSPSIYPHHFTGFNRANVVRYQLRYFCLKTYAHLNNSIFMFSYIQAAFAPGMTAPFHNHVA